MEKAAETEVSSDVSRNRVEPIGLTKEVPHGLMRRIPMWAFLIAGIGAVVCGLCIWWFSGGSDFTAKRWKAREPVIASDHYKSDVRPHPVHANDPTKLSADWTKPHVAVYSVASMKPPHPRSTLRDLAERGQARAIDFMAHDSVLKPHAWPEMLKALNDWSEPGAGEKDPFKFDRVLVATVAKGVNWNPGDRMMWTRVFVQPINFSFAGYTVADTDNVTVKVTSMEATKTRKLSADLGLTMPGLDEGPKVSVSPSSERTIRTTSDISAHYEKLGVDILPNFLRIIRESETGGDVVGNTKISLSVVTDTWTIHLPEVVDMGAKPEDDLVLLVRGTKLDEVSEGDRGKPSIDVLPQAPVPHCPLKARVWMLYEQRHIDAGRKYYDEAKQTVSLVRDEDQKQDVEIVGADDVSPAVWSLKICVDKCDRDGSDKNLKDNDLQAHVSSGSKPRKLVFTDYGQAVKLAHWLRHQREGAILSNLKFNYPVSKFPNASLVPLKNIKNECDDTSAHDG
jgi:hypothetical protein